MAVKYLLFIESIGESEEQNKLYGWHAYAQNKISTSGIVYSITAEEIFQGSQSRDIYITKRFYSIRYIVVGCSHDAWNSGAGDPGIGIALISEMARSFSNAVQKGWKPRRSILFISFDANLFASSGVSHWLQVSCESNTN